MEAGSGFVYDLRQWRRQTPHRLEALLGVSCRTLVTGSPYDGGVSFAHAKNLGDVIPGAVLAELHSPTSGSAPRKPRWTPSSAPS